MLDMRDMVAHITSGYNAVTTLTSTLLQHSYNTVQHSYNVEYNISSIYKRNTWYTIEMSTHH